MQLDGEETGLAPHSASRAPAWLVGAFGGASILVALWFTVGPWNVSVGGRSYSCGSPFMGRYRSVPDPAATASVTCHLQAASRMHIAEVAWLLGLVLVVLGTVLMRQARRRSEGPATP